MSLPLDNLEGTFSVQSESDEYLKEINIPDNIIPMPGLSKGPTGNRRGFMVKENVMKGILMDNDTFRERSRAIASQYVMLNSIRAVLMAHLFISYYKKLPDMERVMLYIFLYRTALSFNQLSNLQMPDILIIFRNRPVRGEIPGLRDIDE